MTRDARTISLGSRHVKGEDGFLIMSPSASIRISVSHGRSFDCVQHIPLPVFENPFFQGHHVSHYSGSSQATAPLFTHTSQIYFPSLVLSLYFLPCPLPLLPPLQHLPQRQKHLQHNCHLRKCEPSSLPPTQRFHLPHKPIQQD